MDAETAEAVYETVTKQTVEIIELRRAYTSLMAQYDRTVSQVDALRAELGGALTSGFERCPDETVYAVQAAASALSVTVELMRAEKYSPDVAMAVERAQRAAAYAMKLVHEGRDSHGRDPDHESGARYRSKLARAEAEADELVLALV